MRLLLDTHLLLWVLGAPDRISRAQRELIESADVHVSSASIWEISIKYAIGKLADHPHQILAEIEPAGFSLLPITAAHAAGVADLPRLHADPFDRLLISQAMSEPMILLTNDAALPRYGAFVTLG